MFPLTRVPFGVPILVPQPLGNSLHELPSALAWASQEEKTRVKRPMLQAPLLQVPLHQSPAAPMLTYGCLGPPARCPF